MNLNKSVYSWDGDPLHLYFRVIHLFVQEVDLYPILVIFASYIHQVSKRFPCLYIYQITPDNDDACVCVERGGGGSLLT